MSPVSRYIILSVIVCDVASILSGLGALATPVAAPNPYSAGPKESPEDVLLSEEEVAFVSSSWPRDNAGRALGGPYSQPHEPNPLGEPTIMPILSTRTPFSALPTSIKMRSSSYFPLPTPPYGAAAAGSHPPAAIHAGGMTFSSSIPTFAHPAVLHPTQGPAWLSTGAAAAQQEGNHRAIPAQMMIVSCVLAGIFVLTFCGCFIMNPRIWGACCGRRRASKRPKPQCSPPPSWMRVLPPSDEEFLQSKRRNAFSIHQDMMEKNIAGDAPSLSSSTNLDNAPSDKFCAISVDNDSVYSSERRLSILDRPLTPASMPQAVHYATPGKPKGYVSSFGPSSTFGSRRSLYDVQEEDEDDLEEKEPAAEFAADGGRVYLDSYNQDRDRIVEEARHSRALSAPIFRLSSGDKLKQGEDTTHRKSLSGIVGLHCFL